MLTEFARKDVKDRQGTLSRYHLIGQCDSKAVELDRRTGRQSASNLISCLLHFAAQRLTPHRKPRIFVFLHALIVEPLVWLGPFSF